MYIYNNNKKLFEYDINLCNLIYNIIYCKLCRDDIYDKYLLKYPKRLKICNKNSKLYHSRGTYQCYLNSFYNEWCLKAKYLQCISQRKYMKLYDSILHHILESRQMSLNIINNEYNTVSIIFIQSAISACNYFHKSDKMLRVVLYNNVNI